MSTCYFCLETLTTETSKGAVAADNAGALALICKKCAKGHNPRTRNVVLVSYLRSAVINKQKDAKNLQQMAEVVKLVVDENNKQLADVTSWLTEATAALAQLDAALTAGVEIDPRTIINLTDDKRTKASGSAPKFEFACASPSCAQ